MARFVRIEKAVSIPDDDVRDIDNTAFGISRRQGMREIVAYTMVEPDGSALVKVPANTALMVSVLDDKGRRITQRHQNWLSLGPGQELKCNGCHDADASQSHGRSDAFETAYAGASATIVNNGVFPGTDPRWAVEQLGETMAEVRARVTCRDDACSSIQPSMDLVYRDVWTADPVIRDGNADIDYRYADLSTRSPTTQACMQAWTSNCRSVINYETVIHPLWSLPRLLTEDDDNDPATPEVPVLDPATGLQVDNNCLNCHTPTDPANGAARVPAGQLELQDGPSPDEPDHFHAYRELLVTDNLQILDGDGALVDDCMIVVDADGNETTVCNETPSPARIAGARASSTFFDVFNDPQDLHFNILSAAEQRLVAEWLDIGAQYYNNPFDAPTN